MLLFLDAVVGRLFGDHDVVHVGLLETRAGDPHEAPVLLELLNGPAAGVPHAGAQAAHQLVHVGAERSAQRHHPLDPLGHQFHVAVHVALEVAVLAPFLHGADGTHAAVPLVGAPLVQDGVARGLLGPREQGADHHQVGAGGDGLGEVPRVLDAAVGDERDAVLLGDPGALGDRRDLRHPDPRHHAGGADGTRPDADLDGVDAGLDERLRGVRGGDVAGHQLEPGKGRLDARDRLQHPLGVAVRRVDDDHVHARLHERVDARVDVGGGAHGGADPQAAEGVLAGVRVLLDLLDVLDGDEPFQVHVVVHHQKLLHPGVLQVLLGLLQGGPDRHRHQLALGHPVRDQKVEVGLEAQVASGTYQVSSKAVAAKMLSKLVLS